MGSSVAPTQVEGKVVGSSTTGPFLSSSDPATEEEVTHPIGQDGAKAKSRKSESSSVMGGIMSTLKKLSTSFVKTQMWK
jgi:hypothetical protein